MMWETVKRHDIKLDYTEYVMCELFEGIRLFWDGVRFLSDKNREYSPPPWFSYGLTSEPAVGILWAGYGGHFKVDNILKTWIISKQLTEKHVERWKLLRYLMYDMPQSSLPLGLRLVKLKKLFDVSKNFNQYIDYVLHYPCRTEDQIEEFYHKTLQQGGAGILLKKITERKSERELIDNSKSTSLIKWRKRYTTGGVVVSHYRDLETQYLKHIIVECDNGFQQKLINHNGYMDRIPLPQPGEPIMFYHRGWTYSKTNRNWKFLDPRVKVT